MSQKEVEVKVIHQIFQDSGDEHYRVEAKGILTVKDNTTYLAYTEEIDDQEATKVLFKVQENLVTLTRKNVNKTQMIFQPGLRDQQPYPTIAGVMMLATNTQQLDFVYDEAAGTGHLDLAYALSANGEVVGQYQVSLQFSPKSSILN